MATRTQFALHNEKGIKRRLFNSTEFERLVEVGIIEEDERVELIEGEIIKMSPIGKHHQACVDRLTMAIAPHISGRAILRAQGPIQIANYTQLQPDIALLKLRSDYYWERLPGAADVLLVIEVSDTTIATDRQVKAPLYAEAGIPEVWIVNLSENVIEVYSDPSGSVYQTVRQAQHGETLSLPDFADVAVSVDAILP